MPEHDPLSPTPTPNASTAPTTVVPRAAGAISLPPRRADEPGRTPALRIGNPERFVFDAADGTPLVVRHWKPGNGPTLVLCDGLGCDGYTWPYVLQRFAGERPVFHMQWRGHGESGVPDDIDSVRLAVIVDDLAAALEAFDIRDVVLLGHSMGVPIALEAWRAGRDGRFAARIRGLGLFCGVFENPVRTWHGKYAEHALTPFANIAMNALFESASRRMIGSWHRLEGFWKRVMSTDFAYRTAVKGELNPPYVKEDDFRPYIEHLARMDMRVFLRLARDMREHSARDVLGTIDVPTLVVGGARDKFAPPVIPEQMHRAIPGSELLMMVEGSHAAPIEQPRILERALLRMLGRIDAKAKSGGHLH
jgi:pimeloyl-ACP methyl ester carboxylesterase